MSRLVIVERSFRARHPAERWFDCMRRTAWPYVWCVHDARRRRWSVTALLERDRLPAVLRDEDATECSIRPARQERSWPVSGR